MKRDVRTVEVTEENFGEIAKKGIVLLDFWASWCGPCRAFSPIYEDAARRHGDVVFGKVDTEREVGLAGAFEIQAIPTLMALRDGVLLFAQPGMMSGKHLDGLLDEIRGLDMDEVKRKIAAEAAADAREERV